MKKTNIFKILLVFILMLFLVGGTFSYYVVKADSGEEPPQTEPETQEPIEGEVEEPLPPIEEQGFFTKLFNGMRQLSENATFQQIINWIYTAVVIAIAIWYKSKTGREKLKLSKLQYEQEKALIKERKLTSENEEVRAMLVKADKQADAMKKAMILAFDRSNLKEDVKDKIKGYFDEVEQLEEITPEKIAEELEEEKVVEPIKEVLNEQPAEQAKPLEW